MKSSKGFDLEKEISDIVSKSSCKFRYIEYINVCVEKDGGYRTVRVPGISLGFPSTLKAHKDYYAYTCQ